MKFEKEISKKSQWGGFKKEISKKLQRGEIWKGNFEKIATRWDLKKQIRKKSLRGEIWKGNFGENFMFSEWSLSTGFLQASVVCSHMFNLQMSLVFGLNI